jgi:hypothetical protein
MLITETVTFEQLLVTSNVRLSTKDVRSSQIAVYIYEYANTQHIK